MNCFGQISIIDKSQQSIEICKLHGGIHTLFYSTNTSCYYIAMSSDNRFDKIAELTLGYTKDNAIQSLNDLIYLLKTTGSTTTILNRYKEKITITSTKIMGITGLLISHEKHAGKSALRKSDLEKSINKIKAFNNN
jgi:hypothetical protein